MLRSGWTWLIALSLPLFGAAGQGCIFDGDLDDDDGVFDDDDDWDPPPPATGSTEPPCPVGAPGCPCTSQGVCDPDLECVASVHTCVVPDGCAIGAAGCACTDAGTCDPGFLCKEEICVSEMPCHPEDTGIEGCQCTAGGACDPGLECLSDFCVQLPDAGSSSSDSGAADGSTSAAADGSTSD